MLERDELGGRRTVEFEDPAAVVEAGLAVIGS